MATLTDTAYVARQFIKYGGIVLVVLMVGRFALNVFADFWQRLHPTPPPPPTMAFGPLPQIKFPQKEQAALTYTLELPNGVFNDYGDRATVYLMPEKRARFLALDETITEAAQLGFKDKPQARTDTVYRFNKEDPLPTTLDVNISTGRMILSVNWSIDSNFVLIKQLPTEDKAQSEFMNYLKKADLVPEDLANGETHITYLKVTGNSYVPTVSLSEADFLRLDVFRAKIDDLYETVTPDPQQGVVRAIVSGNPDKARYVGIEYNYYPVDYETNATYYLKQPSQAWMELQQGGGYIAQVDPGVSEVIVRRVDLGYYDAFESQPYFQPVYIFRGDDNLIAYVPALIEMTTPSPSPAVITLSPQP